MVTIGSPVSTDPTGHTARVENGLALTRGSESETINTANRINASFRILILSLEIGQWRLEYKLVWITRIDVIRKCSISLQ